MRKFLLFFLLLVPIIFSFAEKFEYKFRAGTKYRILSEVDENVFFNDIFTHNAKMLNKISVEVIEDEDGKGTMTGILEMSEQITGEFSTYEVTKKYESIFTQDKFGYTTVDKQYFIPMARNIPSFPDHALKPGDTWSGKGEEVHDFRKGFNIPEPYGFPVDVSYQYLGKDETGVYDLISIKYSVDHKTNLPLQRENYYHLVKITGTTDQVMKWDNKRGRAFSYSEEFNFIFVLNNGDTLRFAGTAKAEVIEAEDLDTDSIAEEIENADIENVHVEKVAEGIKITIENIQFLPDSAKLADKEEEKIAKLIEILSHIPNHDLLIVGHTALAGTPEGRKRISTERAKTIAEQILAAGIRTEKQIRIQGRGAEEPIATNATEEGRRKNRRVEIIILEN
jgi:outer membrane protein OmpA-like peptidoglycan-associated protein